MPCLAHPTIEILSFIYTIIDFHLLFSITKTCPDDERQNVVSNDCVRRQRIDEWGKMCIRLGCVFHSLITCYDFPLFKGLFGFCLLGSKRKIGLRNSAACALFCLFETFFFFFLSYSQLSTLWNSFDALFTQRHWQKISWAWMKTLIIHKFHWS